ncbi:HMA2 domain-containing protein [Citrifermentans bremense]|uniref:HMA2 domain-containing protein n=1 Tax=Citrifermentans bremense TaxID=60035 RepID=UPI00047DDBA8|nr:hypothetical protein [Citrifermentans bremense]
MAPLSVLPGRLRFEANCLTGRGKVCELLEESMRSLPGVSEVSASHRTGRVLVRFDEAAVSRTEIEGHLTSSLQTVSLHKENGDLAQLRRISSDRNESSVGHFVMEMALHAFLPAPLDFLLPAATAFRK